jgi:biotin synthase
MLTRDEIFGWLKTTDPERLESLWAAADESRRRNVGQAVHLRGLIEISNHCARACGYCGLRAAHSEIERYRMSDDEILACAAQAVELGYGTVVLQAGEDPELTPARVTGIVSRIRTNTPLAITLSLGERDDAELARWRDAGADRYLLRFETSNRELFDRIHPARAGRPRRDRIEMLRLLRRLGYEIGSGVMIGIPGQTWEDLARDIEWFAELDLDMIGVGPFIAHPSTPLGTEPPAIGPDQPPNDELTTLKIVALARLACPRANIPSTTALATLNLAEGRERGLQRGANVIMPNLTPAKYRALYEIYPGKACIFETAEQCSACVRRRIESIGRVLGTGRGDSPNMKNRAITRRPRETQSADTTTWTTE